MERKISGWPAPEIRTLAEFSPDELAEIEARLRERLTADARLARSRKLVRWFIEGEVMRSRWRERPKPKPREEADEIVHRWG